ncbi:disease resistance protein [Rosa sericea]
MADIVLRPIMQLGEWIWTPVKRGMSYMVHYKKNLQCLGLQVEKLEAMRNGHKESVDIAEMSGGRIKPELQIWLIGADNAMTDVRQLNGEAGAGEKCFIGWFPNLKWRYNLGKRACNLTTTLNKLVADAKFETVTLEVRRAPEVRHLISVEGFEAFEATRQAMDTVMNALKKNEVTAIGVYGMGGIGKTTLVKQVGAQVCKDGLFDLMITAVVSQNPVVMQIQDQLKDMLTLNLPETTEIVRAARLKERIIRGKKILIILDDIWETIDFSIIGIPSHDELARCGSKVILTTRRIQVCHGMGSQVKIPLNLLSEDDSWNLFVKNARKSFESTNFCEVAKQVAKECGGLPVALIAVARALGDKNQLKEWQEAARRLEISQPASLDDDGRVLKCIRLSYDYLKGEDAKSFFLLCCLFPEDYDIPIKDLIKYGLGKGLFRDTATFDEARSRAHSVINYLKSSNLLLDSKSDECVRMHDVIRDGAMLIASSEYGDGFLVKAGTRMTVWPSNAYEGHSAISLMENDIRKLPQELVCPKLQILLLQDNENIEEIPETFFESLNELKVLDLSRSDISILPQSLSLRTNLQALYLDDCNSISNVSLLGELKKLEILSLRKSDLEELPDEIGNLTKLRMLDLSGSGSIKRIPSNLISRLSRLEELYMRGSFKDWGSKVEREGEETNVGFDELICLSYLNILEVDAMDAKCWPKDVSFNPNWVKFDIRVGDHILSIGEFAMSHWENWLLTQVLNSGVLGLNTTINTLPSWFNSAVTQRAQKLWYTKCQGINNILVEYDHGNLFRLECLVIRDCYKVVTLMDTTTRVPIVNKPVFENLKSLTVRRCYKLLNPLLPTNLLQKLQNLKQLMIGDLDLVEYVFRSEDFGQEQIELREFRYLILYNLPQLENIWSGPAGYAIFCNLRHLEVGNCHKVRYVFTSDVSQSLLQLKLLIVMDCSCLEMIIRPSEGTVNKIILPLLNHVKLINLPQLSSFYNGDNGIECPSLEILRVHICPQFPISTYDFHSRNRVTIHTSIF